MHRKLRIKFTITYIVTTGIILGCFFTWYVQASETELKNQSAITFQSNINSIVYKLQSSKIVDNTWLSQMETGNRLIIHIEDNRKPLMFKGAFKIGEKRKFLVEKAQETALTTFNFDIKEPPKSTIDVKNITFEINGDDNIPYQAATVIVPSSSGWQSLTLLMDLSAQKSAMINSRLKFFAAITIVMLLLSAFGWWFAGKAIEPLEISRKRQTEFVAAASHELRSPLTVIGVSTSALKVCKSENERKKFLCTINSEIKRMSRLIDDLLLLSNADTSIHSFHTDEFEPETLAITTYEAYEQVVKTKKQSLTLSLPEEPLPSIKGDFQMLRQALGCILDNAVFYTQQGGKITLGTYKTKHSIIFYVSDNGKGISDEYKEKVFERFYRTDSSRSKKDHYGLGLSVAKEIIRLHEGKIYVKDTKGGGSTFFIELP